jgi:hypothetical protein
MPSCETGSRPRKKMAIIASYFAGETYGLLGPQMAATVIQENTPYECIVIAVAREEDKGLINKALAGYFGVERPIIGFSTLSGREDLFSYPLLTQQVDSIAVITYSQAKLVKHGAVKISEMRGPLTWHYLPRKRIQRNKMYTMRRKDAPT